MLAAAARASLLTATVAAVLIVVAATLAAPAGGPAPSASDRSRAVPTTVPLPTTTTTTTPAVAVSIVPDTIPSAPQCSEDLPDATSALQAWLDAMPTGDVVARMAARCYRVEGTLEVIGKQRFTLDGRGATLRAFTIGPDDALARRSRAHVGVTGSTEVVIEDLTVDGGDTSPGVVVDGEPSRDATEAQHGFRIDGVSSPDDGRRGPNDDVILRRVRADRVRGDGVYVRASSAVVVEESHLGSSGGPVAGGMGRHGVAVVSGEDIVIERSVVANAAHAVLDIEPNLDADVVAGVTFRDNRVVQGTDGPPGLTFVAVVGADAVVERVAVTGNRLVGKSLWVVVSPPHARGYPYGSVTDGAVAPDPADPSSYRRRDLRIEGNVSDTPTLRSGTEPTGRGTAIFVGGVDGVRVVGNTVPLGSDRSPSRPMALVQLRAVRGAAVARNDAPAADGVGADDVVVDVDGPEPCGAGNRAGWPLAPAGDLVPC